MLSPSTEKTLVSSSSADENSRRERILSVATEQFAEKGFAAVRVAEIADAAEVNKQLIYYYFKSKAVLYDAVLERMITWIAPFWERVEQAPTLSSAVDDWLHGISGAHWGRLLAWEGIEAGAAPDHPVRMGEIRKASLSRLTNVVRAAQLRGEIKTEINPADLASHLLLAIVAPPIFPQLVSLITDDHPDSANFRDRQARLISQLLAGVAPK